MAPSNPKPQLTRRPPVQTRSEESRAKILSAARKAFAEKGFDGANIRDIASSVGITHTLIRYHFGSKDQLWRDVVTDMYARLDVALSEDVIGPVDFSTMDGLRTFLRHYIRYCADHPDQARIMISESLSGSERLAWMINFVRESHKSLAPALKQLMSSGVMPEVWLVSLFYIISTTCQMPFVLSRTIKGLYDVDMSSEAAIEAHTDAVISFLLNEQPQSVGQWPALPKWTK